MSLAVGECLSEDVVVRFLERTLEGDDLATLEQHADQCEDCRSLLAELARTLESPAEPDDISSEMLRALADPTEARGQSIGRFVVLDVLGAGGMGSVLAAYDPELDRKVALKILHPPDDASSDPAETRARLMREAQAMARVQHEHVIAIYEVGAVSDNRISIAMELVEGTTLREWLSEPRDWREVQRVFLQAGRGLAAAHKAGLVHRDFKPENVLVSRDGRVKVTDFGLSVAMERVGEAESVAGTPAYMAPECLAGHVGGPQSDQFSFCVALFEALYGERPYQGKTIAELREATRVAPTSPPAGRSVPTALWRCATRGLAAESSERYDSLDSLLVALSGDPRRRRNRFLAGAGGVVALATTVGVVLALQPGAPPRCQGAEAKWSSTWNALRATAVATAFAKTGRPDAKLTADRVTDAFEAYGERWVLARTDACEATHARGEQSDAVLDARMFCFDRRLAELGALADLFSRAPDGTVVDKAVAAVAGLGATELCDAQSVRPDAPREPADPSLRARVRALQGKLDAATALYGAGQYREGVRVVRAVAAESIEFAPFEASTQFLLGSFQQRLEEGKAAEQSLLAAVRAAERAQNDHLRARAWIGLVIVAGHRLAAYGKAREYAGHALAVLDGLAVPDAVLGAILKLNVGLSLHREGRYDEALASHREARSEFIAADADPSWAANALSNEGLTLTRQGHYDEAIVKLTEARTALGDIYGPGHPEVANATINIGMVHYRQARFAKALEFMQEAERVRTRVFGEGHPEVAVAMLNAATVHEALGEYEKALKMQKRALEILTAAHGRLHNLVATANAGTGNAYARLGNFEKALTHYEESRAINRELLGADAPQLVAASFNMGLAQQSLNRHADALATYQEALRVAAIALPPTHPLVGYIKTNLGHLHAITGQPTLAIEPLEEALALRVAQATDPVELAGTRFALAQALWAANVDRRRARVLARQARKTLAESGRRGEATLKDVKAWLAGK